MDLYKTTFHEAASASDRWLGRLAERLLPIAAVGLDRQRALKGNRSVATKAQRTKAAGMAAGIKKLFSFATKNRNGNDRRQNDPVDPLASYIEFSLGLELQDFCGAWADCLEKLAQDSRPSGELRLALLENMLPDYTTTAAKVFRDRATEFRFLHLTPGGLAGFMRRAKAQLSPAIPLVYEMTKALNERGVKIRRPEIESENRPDVRRLLRQKLHESRLKKP